MTEQGGLISAVFDLDITAVSSIVHRDDTRTATSTHQLFRREQILTPTGEVAVVPIVSGNAWRGVLRRTAETLIAPVLDYTGHLTPAAAHLLRNGGFLRKSSTELSPEDERTLTRLVPVVGLFGGAANARIIGSKLVVSKVVPVTEQTRHILPCPPAPGYLAPATVHAVLRQESTSHFPDAPIAAPEAGGVFDPIRLDTETLIAGTRLCGQIRLRHATATEYALMAEIVDTFATTGHIGGRIAAGHGRVRAQITTTITAGAPEPAHDWRAVVAADRDAAIAALATIT